MFPSNKRSASLPRREGEKTSPTRKKMRDDVYVHTEFSRAVSTADRVLLLCTPHPQVCTIVVTAVYLQSGIWFYWYLWTLETLWDFALSFSSSLI